MEPNIKAPKVAYPDKDQLLALAAPKPASTRIWAWYGSAAAVAGGVLALLTPTTDMAKMPPLARYEPQAIEVKVIEAETPVVERITPKAPKVFLAQKQPQAVVEVAPKVVPQETKTIKPTPAPVQVAYAQPQPTKVAPIAVTPETETVIEKEPTFFDRLLEPFRIERERPTPKQLLASISFTNPFKTTDDESF